MLMAVVMLSAAAIAGVILLQLRVTASRDAQVRLANIETGLSQLQEMPFLLDPVPTRTRARMQSIERSLFTTVSQLERQSPVTGLKPVHASLAVNFAALARSYRWTVGGGKGGVMAAAALAIGTQGTLDAAVGHLDAASGQYSDRATTAQTESIAGSTAAILFLLGAFAFFYRRSFRARQTLSGQEQDLRLLVSKLETAQRIKDEQEQQLRSMVAELEAAQRMKDEFISVISHELRTPLTSIRGYTDILLDDAPTEDQRDHLSVIDRNSKRLLGLVNDLLLVAQIQNGTLPLELSEITLEELIEQAGDAARPLAVSNDVDLEIVAAPGLTLFGDASRLSQVLDNLLSNAIKFTPEGGSVSLTATPAGESAVIEVTDTGIGIPQAEQDQMFARFFRSSSARGASIPGTGLGLVVTKGIVEAHDGTIDFESTEGVGTTFRVVLPLEQASALTLVA